MQRRHSPLPPHGGAFANIPDRVFDRGARRESVIARIQAPDDAAFEIPQPRDVALASGAVTGQLDFAQQSSVVAYNESVHVRAPSYVVGHDDQPEEGPAPGIFGKLLVPASVPPIQPVNLLLLSRLPVAVNAAPGMAFSAVASSTCACPVSDTALTR
jgi:hypothetical protein